MVASIHACCTGVYGDVCFPLQRGIKGCPLLPALFVLVSMRSPDVAQVGPIDTLVFWRNSSVVPISQIVDYLMHDVYSSKELLPRRRPHTGTCLTRMKLKVYQFLLYI